MEQPITPESLFEEEESSAEWLSILADVMMLLIVFFVYCFTLADTMENLDTGAAIEEPPPLQEKGRSVATRSEAQSPVGTLDVTLDEFVRANWNEEVADIEALRLELDKELTGREGVSVTRVAANKLMIRLDGNVFFDTGSTWVKDEMFAVLDTVLPVIKLHRDIDINIQGHTDNVPVRGKRFKNNWELSVLRATETLEYFLHYDVPATRLTASGHADSQPVSDNGSAAGRARNRRIDIMLERVGKVPVREPEIVISARKALKGRSYLSP